MKNFLNGKLLAVLFVITNIVYSVMLLWSLPKLLEYSGGLKVFDMRPGGYSFAEAVELLKSLGIEGIDFYKYTQLRLDLIYPLGFILTYTIGCVWVFKKIGRWKFVGYLGSVCAILAGISDYVENFFIWKMLDSFPQISIELVANSNSATLVKSISTSVAMTIFLIGLLVVGFTRLRNKASFRW